MYSIYMKRILDVAFSFLLLVVLSPLFLIIMLLIKKAKNDKVEVKDIQND